MARLMRIVLVLAAFGFATRPVSGGAAGSGGSLTAPCEAIRKALRYLEATSPGQVPGQRQPSPEPCAGEGSGDAMKYQMSGRPGTATAALEGDVVDFDRDAPIAGATIFLPDYGATTTSGREGTFSFGESVPTDEPYRQITVIVAASTYRTWILQGVPLYANDGLEIHAELRPDVGPGPDLTVVRVTPPDQRSDGEDDAAGRPPAPVPAPTTGLPAGAGSGTTAVGLGLGAGAVVALLGALTVRHGRRRRRGRHRARRRHPFQGAGRRGEAGLA